MRISLKKPPPETSYRLISKNLRQCTRCSNFIRGSITHFANHLKTHNRYRLKYQCPSCHELYSRKNYLIRHGKTTHDIIFQTFNTVPVPAPPIEPVSRWIPPFESTPRCTTIPALITTKSTSTMLQQLTNLPRPISPIPDIRTYHNPRSNPPAQRLSA